MWLKSNTGISNISNNKKIISNFGFWDKSGRSLTRNEHVASYAALATETLCNSKSLISKKSADNFINIFPNIVDDLTKGKQRRYHPELTKHFSECIRYVIPNGKFLRGFLAIPAYEILEKPENLTPENIRLANVMAWIMEIFQAFLITIDDIVDRSEIRRGSPCWYTKENVGLRAIIDRLLLEQRVYSLLKKHFSNHRSNFFLSELFYDITLQTTMGEIVDCMTIKNGKVNLELFTRENFEYVTDYATTYYTFQFPIASAMYMANFYDSDLHKATKEVCRKIGHFHKMKEDFLDCFGDPAKTGKKGDDIREGKFNWFAVTALQKVNSSQRKLMEKYYGCSEPGATDKILDLYRELKLLSVYDQSLKDTYDSVQTHIHKFPKNEHLKKLFFKIINSLDRRNC